MFYHKKEYNEHLPSGDHLLFLEPYTTTKKGIHDLNKEYLPPRLMVSKSLRPLNIYAFISNAFIASQ